jgi:hypothetical protein
MYCLFSIQFQIIITPVVIFKLLVNVFSVLPSVTGQYIYQKFEDTTGIIRICNWRENRQYIYQKFEDTTGIIRICNWRENRQHIYQKFEDTTEVINYPCGVFKLLVNVLSVLPSVTDSNYLCGIFKLSANVLSVLLSVSDSNYHCGIFQLLVTESTFTKSLKITTGVIRISISRENTDNKFTKSLKIRQA